VVVIVVSVVVCVDVAVVVEVLPVQADTKIMASTSVIDTANENMFLFFICVPPLYLKAYVQNTLTSSVAYLSLCIIFYFI